MSTLTSSSTTGKPDYGIDAPGVRQGMLWAGVAGCALFAIAHFALTEGYIPTALSILGILLAAYGLFMGNYMTYSSRVRKVRYRDILLNTAAELRPWTGKESILDVGCGRGLMAIAAAKRLSSGQVFGIDLWSNEDQSQNTPQATQSNARLEGVEDKVSIHTGDARHLPYKDSSFDLVLSHWVVHNLPGPEDRTRTLDEMLRVLRPGGVLVLADIANRDEYQKHLASRAVTNIKILDGGWESRIMGLLSGGSYRPQSLIARR